MSFATSGLINGQSLGRFDAFLFNLVELATWQVYFVACNDDGEQPTPPRQPPDTYRASHLPQP